MKIEIISVLAIVVIILLIATIYKSEFSENSFIELHLDLSPPFSFPLSNFEDTYYEEEPMILAPALSGGVPIYAPFYLRRPFGV